MTPIGDVQIAMAPDGTYKASLLLTSSEVKASAEVWGADSIPGALRGLAEKIEAAGRSEFERRLRRKFEEEGVACAASELRTGDVLADEALHYREITTVFSTGHGRVQVTLDEAVTVWFDAHELVCVLRPHE